jgi:hypothetical protein
MRRLIGQRTRDALLVKPAQGVRLGLSRDAPSAAAARFEFRSVPYGESFVYVKRGWWREVIPRRQMREWEWWAEDAPKWPRFLRFSWRRIVPSEARLWLAWSAVAVVFAVVVTVALLIDAAA